MKTYILASKNAHKAMEIQAILGADFKVITQTEAGFGDLDVIEDGSTFEENAAKKAQTIMEAAKLPVIADDSGLCVDALQGAPGIYTARFAGENATDDENIDKLLLALEGLSDEKRTARFVCVIALAVPGGELRLFRGECSGRILTERHGDNGFGYDPVFLSDDLNLSLAEAGAEAKNKVSHRSRALEALKKELR